MSVRMSARSPLGLLRRHVVRRAHELASAGHAGEVRGPGDAEVGELHGAVERKEAVLRLDIAVDLHPGIIGRLQAKADLVDDVDGPLRREAALRLHHGVEALRQELH